MEEERKPGRVHFPDYEAEAYLRKLDPVVQRLQDEMPHAKFERRSIAHLLAQLMQFMEDALGINSLPPRPFPKIPAKLLRDFTQYGSVYSIAAKCYDIMRQQQIKKFDGQNPAKRKENLDTLALIRRELQKEGYLKTPKVFIHPACSGDMPRLQRIITQLGGELMPSEKTPGVTHIVCPFGPKGDTDDGVEYMRSLESRGSQMLVHHWYQPDSYDCCLPASVAPETVEEDKRIRGPWKVSLRWVLDSEKYNEWMNPIDYETEEALAEQERLGLTNVFSPAGESAEGRDLATKRSADGGADGAEEPAAKRQRADPTGHKAAGRRGDVEAGRGERVAPGVMRQRLVNAEPRWADGGAGAPAENLSQGQLRPSSLRAPGPRVPQAPQPAEAGEVPAGEAGVSGGIPASPAEAPRVLHRVPAHAAWFRYDRIHLNERTGIPEFFTASQPTRTLRAYLDCRNAIIDKYRENARRRLGFSEVRRALGGQDVGALQRIYAFLDHWGLINFEAGDAASGSPVDAPPFQLAPVGLPGTVAVGRLPGAPMAGSLLSFQTPSAANLGAPAATGGETALNAVTRRDNYTQPATQAPSTAARFFCNAMPWVDCTALRYHCTKLPDVDLCPQAFAEGRFPPGCTAKDFIRMEPSTQLPEAPQDWSEQEDLLLLEGLELYGDNWADIAEHVATRSQVQCVLRFLQMPIEDDFLAEVAPQQPPGVAMTADGPSLGPAEQPIPFADVGNPVMAQVAFLASMVSPKVAAAAAQRALEVLAEDDPMAAAELDYISMQEEAAEGAAAGPDEAANTAGGDGAEEAAKPPERQDVAAAPAAETDPASKPMDECGPAQPDSRAGAHADAPVQSTAAVSGAAANGGAGHAAADGPISVTKMRVAAAMALAAAAVRARLLADREEQEARRLAGLVMTAMTQRLARKLCAFEALDETAAKEGALLEAARDQLVAEYILTSKTRVDTQESLVKIQMMQVQQAQAALQAQETAAGTATAAPLPLAALASAGISMASLGLPASQMMMLGALAGPLPGLPAAAQLQLQPPAANAVQLPRPPALVVHQQQQQQQPQPISSTSTPAPQP